MKAFDALNGRLGFLNGEEAAEIGRNGVKPARGNNTHALGGGFGVMFLNQPFNPKILAGNVDIMAGIFNASRHQI